MQAIDPRLLFDRLRRGDGQAISALVATHLAGLRSYIAGYAPTLALAGHVLQRTWLRFAGALDADALGDPASRLHTLAKEELLTCLEEQVRRCMQGQDALSYGVVSRALDRLKSHDRGADDPVPAIQARVAQLDDSQRALLARRYRDRLGLEALARVAGTNDQAVAFALFCIRATLADLGATAEALTAHDRLFATLVEDHLESALTVDARAMLARTIASSLDHLGLFEVQVRMDLVLDAALSGEGTLVTIITEAVRGALTSTRPPRSASLRSGDGTSRTDRQATTRTGPSRPEPAATGGNSWTWIGLAIVAVAALLGLGVLVGTPRTPMNPARTTAPAATPARAEPPALRTPEIPPRTPVAIPRTAAPLASPAPQVPPAPTAPPTAPPAAAAAATTPPAVATVASPPDVAMGARRGVWMNAKAATLAEFFANGFPTAWEDFRVSTESVLAAPAGLAGPFAQRLTAYLVPPISGTFRFAVASSDQSEVWLSPTAQLSDKRLIASVPSQSEPGNRDRYPSQRSPPIPLVAGQGYLIEVLHRATGANNHLTIGWTLPTGEDQFPIPGRHLVLPKEGIPWVRGDPALPVLFPGMTAPAPAAGSAPVAGSAPAPLGAPGAALATATGLRPGLRRERWNGIPGQRISDLLNHPKYAEPPDQVGFEPAAQSLTPGAHFGERLVGWLLPQVSGDFRFDLLCDDEAEVWLGPDDQASNRQLVVTANSDQKTALVSRPVRLEAGRRYHFEILRKEHDGETHCTVGWTLPTGERQAPIPGACLGTVTREAAAALASPSRPGFLRRERWKGLTSDNLNVLRTHPRFPTQPDEVAFEPAAHMATAGSGFGERLVGWLLPPTTGDYRFDLVADDVGELWLSTDDRPAALRRVAFANAVAKSGLLIPTVALVAGRRYYVEILHMQTVGPNVCTVGWTLPSGERQLPIPGAHVATSDRDGAPAGARPTESTPLLVTKPLIMAQRLPLPDRVNLSDVGSLDWSLWAQVDGNPLQVTRKAGVPSQVRLELTGGATEALRHGNYPMPVSWTDGDREPRGVDRRTAVFVDGPGRGYLLTLPADRLVRELRLLVGSWNASCRLDAGLEGEPPPTPDVVPAQDGDRGLLYVIRYAAGVDGRTLRLRWIATSPGHAWLVAVAVQPAGP